MALLDAGLALSPFVSNGLTGCWAEMILLPFVSHGSCGWWAEMILLSVPLSSLASLGSWTLGQNDFWPFDSFCIPLSPMALLDAGLI